MTVYGHLTKRRLSRHSENASQLEHYMTIIIRPWNTMEAAGGNPKIAGFGQVYDCIPRQRLIRKGEEEWGEVCQH